MDKEITVPKGVNFTSDYVPEEPKVLSDEEKQKLENIINAMGAKEKAFILTKIESVTLMLELERRLMDTELKVKLMKNYADNFLR